MIAWFAAAGAVVVALAPWLLGLRSRSRSPVVGGSARAALGIATLADGLRRRIPAVVTRIERLTGRRPDTTAAWISSLDRLARATSTGSSLGQAIDDEGHRADTPPVVAELARLRVGGRSVDEAVGALGPVDDPDGRLGIAVIKVLASTGGPPAEPLDRAAAVLRDRRAAAGERAIGAAQSRISAQVLSLLPVAVTAWSLATDDRLRHVLVGTPAGPVCLAVGGGLDLIGWRWMRRIVERT